MLMFHLITLGHGCGDMRGHPEHASMSDFDSISEEGPPYNPQASFAYMKDEFGIEINENSNVEMLMRITKISNVGQVVDILFMDSSGETDEYAFKCDDPVDAIRKTAEYLKSLGMEVIDQSSERSGAVEFEVKPRQNESRQIGKDIIFADRLNKWYGKWTSRDTDLDDTPAAWDGTVRFNEELLGHNLYMSRDNNLWVHTNNRSVKNSMQMLIRWMRDVKNAGKAVRVQKEGDGERIQFRR